MHRYHRPREFQAKANVPMTVETRDRLALQIRMAGESLIEHSSIDSYNVLSKMLASLVRAGMNGNLVEAGSSVLNLVCDRYEQNRTITVEPEEAKRLRQAIADIDAGLHRISLQRFAKAVAEVEAFAAVVDPSDNEK